MYLLMNEGKGPGSRRYLRVEVIESQQMTCETSPDLGVFGDWIDSSEG